MFHYFVTLFAVLFFSGDIIYAAPQGAPSNAAAQDSYQCGTGNELKCCNARNDIGKPTANGVAGLVSLVGNLGIPVAASCTNVNVLGLLNDGSKCQQTIACCKDNNQNGLINVQCVPINIQI
ncbi:fungal hydrophobin-domain-containing protein [Flagelloscypha sp. PMI_526]|nr:fungal hydrophobin-domain-containing protein [Flagelloscypha sp. PMI_526]